MEQLNNCLRTLNENVCGDIPLLLEKYHPSHVRENRLLHLLREGIVSDDVLKCSEDVFAKFEEKLKNFDKDSSDIVITTDGMLGNKDIAVTFRGVNVNDKHKIIDPQGGSTYRYKGKLILATIHFTTYNGALYNWNYREKVRLTVIHEISHIYNQHMAGQQYYHGDIASRGNDALHSENEAERMLGVIIYASNEAEQDAMCAELYKQSIDSCMPIDRRESQNKPAAYQWLEKLYVAHDYLLTHKDDPKLQVAIMKFKDLYELNVDDKDERGFIGYPRDRKPFDRNRWNYGKFKERSNIAIKRFESRIAQTLKKVKREILGETRTKNIDFYLHII